MLNFRGSQHFRQRLVCATLSGKPIRIEGIREQDQNPGLRDYEACLLRLIEKVTDGCVIEINETGAPHNPVVVESLPSTYRWFSLLSFCLISLLCICCLAHLQSTVGALIKRGWMILYRNKLAIQTRPRDRGRRLDTRLWEVP